MARISRFTNQPVEGRAEPLTPKALTRQEFGRRLQKILFDRAWSQSDLARESEAFDPKGKGLGRDLISTYINGRSFPTPKSLDILCKTLGCSRDELLPNASLFASNDEHPALELRMADGRPGKAWVRVNRLMSFDTASKIVALINEEDSRNPEIE